MAIFPPSTWNVTNESQGSAREPTGADAIRRGTQRLLAAHNLPSLPEVALGNARRADLVAIAGDGQITIVEIKSCRADYAADHKWQDYLTYCDRFFFAVDADFPIAILPEDVGIIRADAYGADIFRDAIITPLSGARRKKMLITCARAAASRHHAMIDLGFVVG